MRNLRNFIDGLWQSFYFAHLLTRLTALILLSALIAPIFLLRNSQKVSAVKLPITSAPTASISAPPQPFIVSKSYSFASNLSAIIPSQRIKEFFSTPTLPEGFEMAQPVSPATSSVISVGNYLGSFFSFISPFTKTEESNYAPNLLPNPPAGSIDFDFDNDGKADIGRWRASAGGWEIKNSSNGTTTTLALGSASSVIAPADYDGDGITDMAVFTASTGTWTIKRSSDGQTQNVSFGTTGDKAVSGDYDGDGIADVAVWRPSNGTWYVKQSSNGQTVSVQFGVSSDIAVPGNYDGDSKMDYAVFRPSTGDWHVLFSSAGYGYGAFHWGISTDIPAAADYDGDGKTDYAVYRPSTGTWYAYKSSGAGQYFTQVWGNYGDQPTPADYDGDGKADFSVWRPTTGVWHTIKSSDQSFSYQTLGINGDTAVTSAYLKQIGGQVFGYDFAKTRLSPKNATGGTDLYSRNFGWSSGLVGLSGRAGLNAGFGISYNSLVWTKHDNTMVFDADISNVSPGFRFGFPTIEPVYYNDEIINPYFAYLMITPSGDRVEFRQIGASEYFETADSSYTQLKVKSAPDPNEPVEDIEITVTGTDGTQMEYRWIAGAFRCYEIKDRNGNFISINHDNQGLLKTVTDTLGRVINVNYDSELYPTTITQNWQLNNGESSTTTTRTYATFVYTTLSLNPSFDSSLTVYGPTSGTVIKVLDKIIYGTSSSNTGETRFEYNDFGQVKKVRNMAADGHELSYVITNLHTPGTNLLDVPRLTQTKSWTENFNGGAEITFDNTFTENQSIPEAGGNGTLITVSMTGHPNSAVSKNYVGSSGWMESLPIVTEDWADGARKRWTQTDWTQDDTNLSYIKNPRVMKTKVADNSNVRRTEIDYWNTGSLAAFGLVKEVRIYNDGTNALQKKTTTNYKDDAAYLSRRIIGLPSQSELYDGNGFLMSKVTYAYDEGNFNDNDLQQNISPIQHDNTYYGASFIIGRGNPTSVTRHDVLGQSSAVTSSVKYNTAGAVVAQIDPLGRTAKISYADKFNDGGDSRNTFAYPTKVTDPAGYYSEAEYRFDAGANVWAKSPTPQGTNNSKGKETTRIYDSFGRLERETLVNHGGAYTRFEYPSNGIQTKIYATLTTGAGEIMSERWTDGAGRVRYSRVEHPGSTGGWSGSKVEYDILGRVTRSTVPTEINSVNPTNPSTWIPAGDDDRGLDTYNNPVWLWNSQEYDWQGRVTRKINTDGTDQLISYNGCGCAGGLETTIQSELVPRDDQPTTNARRKQKVYADILGREYKSEVFDWGGNVYSTTVQSFNGRDQITQITQYAGTENPNNTHQDTVLTYDGHGRLKTRHNPIEDSLTNTTWIYNSDDTIQQVIDPRGAITNYTYNDPRGLLTQISYDPPATQPTYTTIPDTPNVNFSYDAAGNRTQMTDGTGSTAYSYDELSRLKSETKTFTGLTGNFTIGYDYELSGKLKTITDPFGATVNYNDDKAGRTTSITGSGFLDVTTYANNIKYRAFGSVKEMDYGNAGNSHISYQFDNRLQTSSYESTTSVFSGGYVRRATYEYFDDGRIKKADNLVDSGFKQTYSYDFAGRLKTNDFGMKMNSQNEQVQVYAQSLQYNVFGDITSRGTTVWGDSNIGFTASYANGRKQNSNEIYDALGNVVDITSNSYNYDRYQFDAAARMTQFVNRYRMGGVPQTTLLDITTTTNQDYDGDGKSVKRVETKAIWNATTSSTTTTSTSEYFVRSSVLDKVLTELDEQGGKKLTNVYTGNAVLAEQKNFPATSGPPPTSAWSEVYWRHEDIVTGSHTNVNRSGQSGGGNEFEAFGGIVPAFDPNVEEPEVDYQIGGNVYQPESGCAWDGTPINCSHISFILRGSNKWQIRVNIRAEGGWGAYYNLRNQVSVRRYDIYREGDWRINRGEVPAVGDDNDEIRVDTKLTYIASMYVFLISPFWEAMLLPLPDLTEDQISSSIAEGVKEAKKLLDKTKKKEEDSCKNFIENQLEQGEGAVEKIKKLLDGGATFDTDSANEPGSVDGNEVSNIANYDTQIIEFYESFFSVDKRIGVTTSSGTSIGGIGGPPPKQPRTPQSRGQILIHEALHLLAKGNSDVSLANKADPKGKQKFEDTKEGRAKAAEYLQKQINKYCD